TDVDFTDAKLNGTGFDRARLVNVSFRNAQLRGAILSDAELKKCNFEGAQMEDIKLDARAKDCLFRGAMMKRAFLPKAFSWNCNFEGADLSQSDCTKLHVQKTSLHKAILRECHFLFAIVSEVDLREAILDGASFEESRIDSIRVYGVSGLPLRIEDC